MKECRSCKKTLPLEMFYRHKKMADGTLNFCKNCVRSRVGKYRHDNIERVRLYDRMRGRLEHRKRRVREYARLLVSLGKGRKKNRDAQKAWCRQKTSRAVARGLLNKGPCEVCGSVDVEAHHVDYNNPLLVKWLCVGHHKEIHRKYCD